MLGLTNEGLRAKIKDNRYELTEKEAVDLFFLHPTLVELTWEKGNVTKVRVNGLNLDFPIAG